VEGGARSLAYPLRKVPPGLKAADAIKSWGVVRSGDPGLLLLLLAKVPNEALVRCRPLLPAFRSLRVVAAVHPIMAKSVS
jgi:hypothetical protein